MKKNERFFFIFKNILSKFIMKYFFRQEKKETSKKKSLHQNFLPISLLYFISLFLQQLYEIKSHILYYILNFGNFRQNYTPYTSCYSCLSIPFLIIKKIRFYTISMVKTAFFLLNALNVHILLYNNVFQFFCCINFSFVFVLISGWNLRLWNLRTLIDRKLSNYFFRF